MVKITCPNCGNQIELDKNSYNELLNDIASDEVEKRVTEQTKALEASFKAQLELEKQKAKTAQDNEIAELKQKNAALQESFDTKLALEKEQLNAQKEKELTELRQANANLEAQHKLDLAAKETEIKTNSEKEISELKQKNASLEEKLNNSKTNTELEVAKAVQKLMEDLSSKDNRIIELQGEIDKAQTTSELEKKQLKENYDFALEAKDREIAQWKEFRMGDSTKDIGESLEQYCSDAFNEIRPYAYPNCYFEKDNIVDEEGKGDFIFRDYDGEIEIVSIMFEMKNQKDDTEKKHKNEDFFKKLDKNRTSKNCEYAVLVSTLEEDSKLYSNGIVDVSHKYPKMFVVRPQYFLAIIGLIRNLSLNNVKYKQELIAYQQENIDVTNFENAVQAVANQISDDYAKSATHYDNAEKLIDDMINKLTKLKEEYRLGNKWIGTAKNRLPELEVRKLTKNNPTMKEKFEAFKNKKEEQ